jgi:DNA modification methylase
LGVHTSGMIKKVSSSAIHIVSVSTHDLKASTYNPRKWSETAIKQLTESIERFGLVDPILVNGAEERKNIVIGGHFRLKIAKDLGYTEVPVVYINIPEEEKERELNLRLNRNTGDWDFEMLKDFDMDLLSDIGFNDEDLSMIWDDESEVEGDNFDTQKALEEAKKDPQTKEGELFQLGNHRLICGDSTDTMVIAKLLEKTKINTIYTDPPFNISLDYEKGLGGTKKYASAKVDDQKSYQDYQVFLEQTLRNGLKHCEKNAHIFYYCDQTYIGLLQSLYQKNGVKNKRVCLWIKNNQNATPQVAFNKCYEPCVYGTIGKPYLSPKSLNFTEILNPEIGTGNQTIEDIEDLLDIWLVKRLPTAEYLHPTEKPCTLHERPLKRCTKPGDAILDLFGGSGSTLIACDQLGRKAFLVEKDPAFCDVIISRWELQTKQKAQKITKK